MFKLIQRTTAALVLAAGSLIATSAAAVPINFAGDLTDGTLHTINDGMLVQEYNLDPSFLADGRLWTLSVNAGDVVTVTGLRISDIDPWMIIWNGLESDTDAFSDSYSLTTNTTNLFYGDDELPANFASTQGCCGDPEITFTAATTGIYMVSVQGLGGDGSISHGYTIQATGATGTPAVPTVPLPAALPLLLAGLGGMGIVARRRRDV